MEEEDSTILSHKAHTDGSGLKLQLLPEDPKTLLNQVQVDSSEFMVNNS